MSDWDGIERRDRVAPTNEVLGERFDALAEKVDEFRVEVKEDIGHLTNAIGNLAFVDQRVHDIEIAAMKELIRMIERTMHERADVLERDVELEKERRALNFRLAIGALISAFMLPLLVGLLVYVATKGAP